MCLKKENLETKIEHDSYLRAWIQDRRNEGQTLNDILRSLNPTRLDVIDQTPEERVCGENGRCMFSSIIYWYVEQSENELIISSEIHKTSLANCLKDE